MFEKMGNALKKKKQQIDNKIEGANTTINVVSKAVAVKNNVFEWISKNPEKAAMIFLGCISVITVGSELKRNKTEVTVNINMIDPSRGKMTIK